MMLQEREKHYYPKRTRLNADLTRRLSSVNGCEHKTQFGAAASGTQTGASFVDDIDTAEETLQIVRKCSKKHKHTHNTYLR
jgi:hypothetical protein